MTRGRLSGLEKIELGLPVPQHVRFDPDDAAYLSDLEIDLVGQTGGHGARSFLGGDAVEVLLKNLARLKGKDFPPHDDDLFACLGIAPFPRTLAVHNKVAEAGYLNLLPSFQAAFDDLKGSLYHIGGFLLGKPHLLIDTGNDICLCHL